MGEISSYALRDMRKEALPYTVKGLTADYESYQSGSASWRRAHLFGKPDRNLPLDNPETLSKRRTEIALTGFPATTGMIIEFAQRYGLTLRSATVNFLAPCPGVPAFLNPHIDTMTFMGNRVMLHCAINVPEGAFLTVPGRSIKLENGEVWRFAAGDIPHGAIYTPTEGYSNPEPRIVLVIDVLDPPESLGEKLSKGRLPESSVIKHKKFTPEEKKYALNQAMELLENGKHQEARDLIHGLFYRFALPASATWKMLADLYLTLGDYDEVEKLRQAAQLCRKSEQIEQMKSGQLAY